MSAALKNLIRETLVAQRTIAQEIIAFDAVIDFITSSLTNSIPAWTNTLTFNTDGSGDGEFCLYPDTNGALRYWKTKTDGNINNAPPTNPATTENTNWIEVSPSAGSALKEWAAGLYGTGLIIVVHNNDLYKLANATRPYLSANINTEILDGDWLKIGEGPLQLTADATAAPIILDSLKQRDVLVVASEAITAGKTLQFDNDDNLLRKKFLFIITGTPVLELPADCKMPGWQSGWTDADKELDFAAIGEGDFQLDFIWNSVGGYYQATLSGPF